MQQGGEAKGKKGPAVSPPNLCSGMVLPSGIHPCFRLYLGGVPACAWDHEGLLANLFGVA